MLFLIFDGCRLFFRKTKLAGVSLRFNVILKNGGWLFNAQKKEKTLILQINVLATDINNPLIEINI
jgi:hypothetical protein